MHETGMHEVGRGSGVDARPRVRARARWRAPTLARAREPARTAGAAPLPLPREAEQLWLRGLPKRPPPAPPPPDPQLWLLDWRPRPRPARPPAPPPPPRRLPVIGPGPLPEEAREYLARISEPVQAEVVQRPRTRGECADGPRPCPWVSCRHHLFLDVNASSGSIKLNHPFQDLEDMAESCALDVADRGPVTLAEIAVHLNISLQRVLQIELEGRENMLEELSAPPPAQLTALPRTDGK